MTDKEKLEFNFDLPDEKQETKEFVPDEDKKTEEKNIDEKVDEMLKHKKGSPSSAEEQARRFEEVLQNPPEKGYNNIRLHKAVDEMGNTFNALINEEDGKTTVKDENGKNIKVDLLDPLIELDLNTLFEGQLQEASIDIIPTLMDEKVQLEMNENKEYKPEKPKKESTIWYWLGWAAIIIPMVVIAFIWLSGIF